MRHTPSLRPRALMGLLFFPRGGSAQVTRSLAHVLPQQGWDVTVMSSSLHVPGLPGDAHTFFAGLDLTDLTAPLPWTLLIRCWLLPRSHPPMRIVLALLIASSPLWMMQPMRI